MHIPTEGWTEMKMTMKFSYNSLVKIHGEKIWVTQHYPVISKSMLYIMRSVTEAHFNYKPLHNPIYY